MTNQLKRFIVLLLVSMFLMIFAAGCNTIEGAGEDIEEVGDEVEETTDNMAD